MATEARDPEARIARLSPAKRALLELARAERPRTAASSRQEPIAIIGIGARFPAGGNGPEAFWRLLADGVDAITEVPRDRWDAGAPGLAQPGAAPEDALRWGGFLSGVDLFDPQFFGISPREAEAIDPQQRLLLEVCWEALEDAGFAADRLAGSLTGVFVGITNHDYGALVSRSGAPIDPFFGTGNAASVAAGRISFVFGFQGPSVALDTACSSSLVAAHLACQSLRTGECSLALAGGVNLILSPEVTIYSARIGVLARDGRCRSFDAAADGYGRGEGCGMVVLKRLSEALADGDHVYAVVRGSAVNQDGRSSGLTAPNGPAQQAVIRQALANAGVAPCDIAYVEAHGSGTPLGDPIEVQALGAVLGEGRPPGRLCAIGSVKSNLGHLESAAGIAGLIKVALALHKNRLPPSLHFERPNPHIPFDRLPLQVQTELGAWPEVQELPALAGLSSFGFSGTNAHLVLERASVDETTPSARPSQLLVLSARSGPALETMTANLAARLAELPGADLADVAFTLATGRRAFAHRRTLVARGLQDAVGAFSELDPKRVSTAVHERGERGVAFLFPGLGDHYPDMALGLYRAEPVFRRHLDRCADLLAPRLGRDLRELLFPGREADGREGDEEPSTPGSGIDLRKMLRRGNSTDDAAGGLKPTALAQPAVFALEYALARLWMEWGIRPRAMIGYSLGEYVAACLAGVFTLEEALGLVAERAQRIQELPAGAMLAVPLPEAKVRILLPPEVSLAAVNGPERCVVAGPGAEVEALRLRLAESGLVCPALATTHAFHSAMMDPLVEPFAELVRKLRLRPPSIPYLSNVTGTWITAEQATDPAYWARHLRQTVRFADGVGELIRQSDRALLEVGPGQTLGLLARQQAEEIGAAVPVVAASLRYSYEHRPDVEFIEAALGKLWLAGVPVSWKDVYGTERRRRIPLPTYPFERRRCWFAAPSPVSPTVEPREAPMEESMPQAQPVERASPRREAVAVQVQSIFERVTGLAADAIDPAMPFLEMGADSIVLGNAVTAIQDTFGVKLEMRQLFEELTTLDDLIVHLEKVSPSPVAAVSFPAPAPVGAAPAPAAAASPAEAVAPVNPALAAVAIPGSLDRIVAQQLEQYAQGFSRIVAQQLQALQGRPLPAGPGPAPAAPAITLLAPAPVAFEPVPAAEPAAPLGAPVRVRSEVYVPYRALEHRPTGMNDRQREHVAALTARLTARTAGSKRFAARYRGVLADSRSLSGFRLSTKEMVYPIVGARGRGSRMWDVDGNEYVDITMGFGVNLFGNSPAFLDEALAEHLRHGMRLGPRADRAGEAAELLCELTGKERAAFFSSGSEAVMVALRLARAATGRSKVALFAGSYHGQGDGTLMRKAGEDGRALPVAPGVPQSLADNILVLDYGEPRALDAVAAHAHELAAVLVEPVQSRRPELQPTEFLRRLRELTRRLGVPLVFDEMITGFRVHPAGAQGFFGVEADLATYGKIVGGGLPVGVVAGRSDLMGGVDGGVWSFGDGSYPQAVTTLVGGTFCQHPLAVSAACAVLAELKRRGPALQRELNAATARMAERINALFVREEVPIQLVWFGSGFRFNFSSNLDLFFYHLLEKGVYVWELRNFFLSTAHDEADIDALVGAVEETLAELRRGGFLPDEPGGARAHERAAVARSAAAAAAPIAAGAAPESVPLHEVQRQIWLACQLGEEAAVAYQEAVVVRLSGDLRPEAFRSSFERLVARHEALRTSAEADGQRQWIAPAAALALPLLDLSALEDPEREAALWLEKEVRRPFALDRAPLLRCSLLRLAERLHLLVITVHHLVVDGWSAGVLLEELSTLYSAFREGRVPELPAPPRFCDYIRAREQHGADPIALAPFWRERLQDPPPALELPADRPRPLVRSFAGGRRRSVLDRSAADEVRALGRKHGCTLFMTLLAAYVALLRRLTHQEGIMVGIPSAGRSQDSQRLVGCCADLLPVRDGSGPDPAWHEHLVALRRELLDVYAHQDVPFGCLLQILAPRRDAGRSPLVETIFNLDRPAHVPPLLGLTAELEVPPVSGAKFDLGLNAIDHGGEVLLDLDFNRDLFEPASALRILGQLRSLLAGAATNPGAALSELPLLGAAERHQVAVEWAGWPSPYPRESAISVLFEAQADRAPEAVALTAPGEAVTYTELDLRANRLARELLARGAGPEVPVALCLERSMDMVVATLAVLKAGGAYLPLDPAYPPERLRFMLEDAGAQLIVSRSRLLAVLPQGFARVVCLDRDAVAIRGRSGLRPAGSAGPESLAYLMYTSGSTGRPKGIAVPHAGVVRLVMASDYVCFGPGEVFLQLAATSFDAATFEIWGSLLHGGRLHIPAAHVLSLEELGREVECQGITAVFVTTALFHRLVDGPLPRLGGLRYLVFGGETLSVPHARRALAILPGTRLVHAYGPTESTTFTCCLQLADPAFRASSVPVGYPIANTRVHVLDRALHPVPPGVTGELAIGGDGLARGYAGRPAATAEKLIPDAFAKRPGERLYRTGDLVRSLPSGAVDFIGRIDHQVKIRGFRIEPGEIEAILGRHPQVRQGVVVVRARAGMPGERHLVAYVAAASDGPPTAAELSTFLRRHLPEYMIPAAIVVLAELPLGATGKVDRSALPVPEWRGEADFRAPRTPVEELLAGLWAEVLGVERVGVDDNFFALGGHSLLATALVSRVRQHFGVELPLRAVFELPTVAALAPRLVPGGEERSAPPPIVRAHRGTEIPLSFAQERLWFLDQLEPGRPWYNIPAAVRLAGALDVAAFRASLAEVVRRHEALRTSFPSREGQPLQLIARELAVALPVVDLGGLGERAEAELLRLAAAEARRPFDLAAGPVLRATLLRLSPRSSPPPRGEHALLLTLHHIAADGWSMGVLLRELAALYPAALAGHPSPLPPLALQYADFACWQRSWLQGEALEAQLGFFREELAGAPTVLDLPVDRPRPAVRGSRDGHLTLEPPASLVAQLEELARGEGATLFMTLLAGFGALLGRWSNQGDLLVGSPIANRTQREVEGLIGFFVNTLALRVTPGEAASFRDLLGQVRGRTLAAYANQDLPFERLVEDMAPQRDLGTSPLVQAVLALQNAPLALDLPGLAMTHIEVHSGVVQFDLTLSFGTWTGRLAASLLYAGDIFDRATMMRFARNLEVLLAGAAADPGGPLTGLPLLAGPERHQLLVEWSGGGAETMVEECLTRRFEATATRRPAATALVHEGEHVSYGELNRRANRLARHLLALGVRPGERVGLLCERSSEMITAVLAVLKAGAVYVPLDPVYPRERLEFLLGDAGIGVLLTTERPAEGLGEAAGIRLVRLDRERHAISAHGDANLPAPAPPDAFAYVIYTSGSTGRPKGVAVTHANVVRLFAATRDRFDFGAQDVWTLFHSYAFDFSVWELWGPLLHGGRLVVVPYWVSRSPRSFLELLRREQVSVLNQTPSAFRQLAGAEQEEPARDGSGLALRLVVFGGEALAVESLAPWLERHGDRTPRLVNMYGITETTVHVTYCPLGGRDVAAAAGSPVGRAIPDLAVYLLDAAGRPVPLGAAGEIHVGGAGVASGYLGRPELTAGRFVPDPFGGAAGARLYRSGDLARQRADGDLEYLGRIDQQVKIRGFRIEPGEIEAALAAQPAVAAAAVLARAEGDAGARLVAYVVPRPGARVEPAVLRAALARALPEHMIPAAFVVLAALPLTSHGKLDRRALPAPESPRARPGERRAPRTPVEEMLSGIWAEVLGCVAPGPDDSFFDLGGHSLLATQVASRLRASFGVELPLRELFRAQTLDALAAEVEAAMARGGEGARPQAPPISRAPREGALPLSFAQERLWFLDQLEPGSPWYNVPAAVRLRGPLEIAALAASFEEIARRHEILRTTFPVEDGVGVQSISPAPSLGLGFVDLEGLPGMARDAEARRLGMAEARRPFDLARGPLARAALLRLAPDEHRLLLTFHHIVADGWSFGVLLGELRELYPATLARRPVALPELGLQYADYAVWQRSWLAGGVLADLVAHWRERLAGAPPLLALPADRPRTAAPSDRGGEVPVEVPPPLAAALAGISRRGGVTLFMSLLAAFASLLGRQADQEDLVLAAPIANRTRREVEGLIGFFVNTLVLRCDLAGDPTFEEQLGRARETCLLAYAHQDLPFEKLVQELAPERTLHHSPLFQAMLALQNAPLGGLDLAGLACEPVAADTGTAKLDLKLALIEMEGRLVGSLAYSRDLFDRATVYRLADRLLALLTVVASDPSHRPSEIPLLAEGERSQLLVEWAGAEAPFPRHLCVHQAFAAQAERTPDAVAVGHGKEALSFGGLAARADRLARALRGRGVGPEVPVALCLERSVDMIAAILAVLAAGGAFVPLDPAAPAQRLAELLEDSGAPVVLTQERLRERLPAPAAERAPRLVLAVDRPPAAAGKGALTGEPARVDSRNLCYVIYTSGSTGRPKGTMIQHRSVVHLAEALRQAVYADLEAPLRVAVNAPIAFDAAVKQLVQLLYGHALDVVPEAVRRDPDALLCHLRERAVDVLDCTPSQLRLLLASGLSGSASPAPRRVLVGGEAIDDATWSALAADARRSFVNVYGPTECTVDSTSRRVVDGQPTIGRPVPNNFVYVLDRRGLPVPQGVAGQLHVGGAGLARGYLQRPDLTARQFLPDPLGGEPGGRLYATGDLVRWRTDGTLEYLGRIDHQVKVRGFRIELGEVEAALAANPAVGEAVVVARDHDGDRRLVAYLVAREPLPPWRDLRALLGQRLPEPMVPASFVALAALPLTPNGKVDRRALPPPPDEGGGLERGQFRTWTPVEEILAGIWGEVLGIADPLPGDDFFALGGHSLLAIRILSRIERALGVALPVRALFEAPTLSGLARAVERARAGAAPPAAPPLRSFLRHRPPPLSFSQEGLWFLDRLQPGSAAYNIPTAARLAGNLGPAALGWSLGELVRRHESLRTTFTVEESRPVQMIAPLCTECRPGLPLVDLTGLALPRRERAAQCLVDEEARRPFDLAAGPLLRTTLLRLDDREHLLLTTLHHIVADGWSMRVLVRELAALYTAALAGRPSPLAELPVQYADFALWQRGWLQGETLAGHLAYWRERLAGMTPLDLPADRPRPAFQRLRGSLLSWSLSPDALAALQRLGRREGATLFMVLLAGFKALLHRWSGGEDIVVGTPVAGRSAVETEGLIGLFVNSLVLRTSLAGRPDFRQALARVRDTALDAFAHQDLPFELLVDSLAPARDLSRAPLYQVLLVLQSAGFEPIRLPDLEMAPVEVDNGTAKLDLSLSMAEVEGRLAVHMLYNADLLDRATVEHMAGQLRALLKAVAQKPGARLDDLDLGGPAEREQLARKRESPARPVRPEARPGNGTPTGPMATPRKQVPPRTLLERYLWDLWQRSLPAAEVGIEDDFFELGGNSLAAAVLVHELQQALGEIVHVVDLFDHRTIRGLARRLEEGHEDAIARLLDRPATGAAGSEGRPAAGGGLVGIQPGAPGHAPFFLVHPIFGDVHFYRHLARALGSERPVYAFESPGLTGAGEPPGSIEQIAATYLEALRGQAPRGPYLLGGSSMGGAVALEMARELLGGGEEVPLVALMDTWMPGAAEARDETDDLGRELLGYLAGPPSPQSLAHLVRLGGEERAGFLLAEARRAGRVPADFGLDRVRRLLATANAHRRALRDYVPAPYGGKVVFFRAARRPGDRPAPDLAWSGTCAGGLDVHEVPGDHVSMLLPPEVEVLAQRLRPYLDGAWRDHGRAAGDRLRERAPYPNEEESWEGSHAL